MSDTIAWARLDSLKPVVLAVEWRAPTYVYLERVADAWLTPAEQEDGVRLEVFDEDTDWDVWERGRVFCPTCELRWEKLDGAFQVVYIGPPVELPGFELETGIDLSYPEDRSYALWGNRVPEAQLSAMGVKEQDAQSVFLEFAVPRVLHYPVSDAAQRVRVRVRAYLDQENGAPIYYRFCGLEEAQ